MKSNRLQRKIRRVGLLIAAGVILLVGMLAQAGGGPEGVIVVVNEDSWASLAVANEFVHLRKIPSNNVIYLKGGTNWAFDSISIENFREHILKPVLDEIRKRNLHRQIDCIAYSADVPYRIHLGKDLPDGKARKPLTSSASINSMTYMYRWVLPKQPGDPSKRTIGYLSLRNNWYARRRMRRRTPQQQFTPEQRQNLVKAGKLLREKKWTEAEKIYLEVIETRPDAVNTLYNLACCLARQEKLDEAMAILTKSVEAGWHDRRHIQRDEDLKALRGRKDFKALLGKVRSQTVSVQPPIHFSSRYGWTPTGKFLPPARPARDRDTCSRQSLQLPAGGARLSARRSLRSDEAPPPMERIRKGQSITWSTRTSVPAPGNGVLIRPSPNSKHWALRAKSSREPCPKTART